MRTALRLATALALVLLLTACMVREQTGSAEPTVSETTATDPATDPDESSPEPPTPSESSTTEPGAATMQQSGPVEVTGDAGVRRAVVVSGSDVGGDVSPLAFPLETTQEREDFGAGFDRGFDRLVSRAVRSLDAPAGTMPWGTVVAIACQGPDSVRIDAGEAGFEVTPRLPKSTVQCLVPVTYVVVFAAPTG